MTKEYLEYINSEKWQEVRKRFFSSKFDQFCYVCHRSDVSLDLHHKTYKRLGDEYLRDLILLCRKCHQLTHAYSKKYDCGIWSAAKKLKQKLGLRKRKVRYSPNYISIALKKLKKVKWAAPYLIQPGQRKSQ